MTTHHAKDGQPISELEPDVRCASCKRLLFRGKLEGEIKCRCGYLMRFRVGAVGAKHFSPSRDNANNSP